MKKPPETLEAALKENKRLLGIVKENAQLLQHVAAQRDRAYHEVRELQEKVEALETTLVTVIKYTGGRR